MALVVGWLGQGKSDEENVKGRVSYLYLEEKVTKLMGGEVGIGLRARQ